MISRIPRFAVLTAGAVLAAACGAGDAGRGVDDNPLVGTAWLVSSIDGQEPVPGRTPLLRFTNEDMLGGSGGCNDFDGRYSVKDDRLDVVSIETTLATCSDDNAQDLENQFFAILREDPRFATSDGALTLESTASEAVIRLVLIDS